MVMKGKTDGKKSQGFINHHSTKEFTIIEWKYIV